ncbi:MAG: AEC family transporter [Phascolarctobacterium sp.]|nr:AEC family transporter [Phascolarctobacterium sp.]
MIYYIANTVLFWTMGVCEVALDALEEVPWISRKALKVILNPLLIGLIIGIILVMLGVKLPEPVYRSCYYIGSMTSPLAMLFVGIAMSMTACDDIRIDFPTCVAMLGRFFICQLLLFMLLPLFNIGTVMGRVFVICAALSSVTNLFVVLKGYGGDYRYAAMLVTVSTCLSVCVIPFYMWLIH